MLLTLDSSVIVAALLENEPSHADCLKLLSQVQGGQHIAVQPLTVLVEIVAAVRRRTGSEPLAARVYRDLSSLHSLRFIELDETRTRAAQLLASRLALRGMDAIVVQVAEEFGSTLVTLDTEIAVRATRAVQARRVDEF